LAEQREALSINGARRRKNVKRKAKLEAQALFGEKR